MLKEKVGGLMAKVMRDKDMLTFKEATANMTRGEKVGHIWEYYKWIIIGGIAGVLLVFSITHTLLTQTDSYLTITLVSGFEHTASSFAHLDLDDDVESSEEDLPDEDFLSEAPVGIWVDLDIVSILEDLLLNDEQSNNYDITVQQLAINFETIPVFTAHIGAGVIDIIVTYVPDLHAMVEIGHFENMTNLGWDIPANMMHNEYAVYLRYFSVFDDYIAAPDDLVLGISATTQNIENIKNFFETLLD